MTRVGSICLNLLMVLAFWSSAGQAASLHFEPKDATGGIKDGGLRVMINLHPYHDEIKKLQATGDLNPLKSAIAAAVETEMKKKRFQKFDAASVELVLLTKVDEYGRPDLSTLKKVGKSVVKKTDGKPTVTEISLEPLT